MNYSEIFSAATYTCGDSHERFKALRDNRDGAVCVETNGDPVFCDTWNEFLDLCSESGYSQLYGFEPLTSEPEDWEDSFGYGVAEWLKARLHSEITPQKWLPECRVSVNINYYVTGSGYSHTEPFDYFTTDNFMTAQAYWDGMDDPAAFWLDVKDGWLEFVLTYHAASDDGYDTAIYTSRYDVSSDDPAFDDCRGDDAAE